MSNTTADDLSESVTVGNSTDLAITKIVDNGTPDEGDTVTFTVTVTNNGPAQATNVSLDDVLPADLTAGTITPSQGSYAAPTWTVGTLANSSSATLTIQATVNTGEAGQTITNTVTKSAWTKPTATPPPMIPVNRSPSVTVPIWSSLKQSTTEPRMRATPSPSLSRSQTTVRLRPLISASMMFARWS